MTFFEQMANVGSEVFRAISWREKGNKEYSQMAGQRALELFDLTIQAAETSTRLKEVLRAREVFADYFFMKIPANLQLKAGKNILMLLITQPT